MEKKVEMKVKQKVQEEKKLSYEELEKVANQLSAQCQQLAARVQQRDYELTFRRLDYLFEVVANMKYFPTDFTDKCVNEIMNIMYAEEPKEEPKTE